MTMYTSEEMCEYGQCTNPPYAYGKLPGAMGPYTAHLCRHHWETKTLLP